MLIMEHFKLLFMLWSLALAYGQSPGCSEIQLGDLGDSTMLSTAGLLADTLAVVSGDATAPPSIQISQINIVCLAQAVTRDTYISTSVVVEYMGVGAMPAIAQVEYQCMNGAWGFATPSITTTPTSDFSTAQRTDCIICINDLMLVVPETNCLGEFL